MFMINFVNELPPVLEPNSIYYLEGSIGNAVHFVSDNEGNAKPVSLEQIVQAYMASLRGAANGYAGLDGSNRLPVANLPTGSKPAEISSAINAVEGSLQAAIDTKASSSSVYTRSHIDGVENSLQSQVNGKQAQLSNATAVAKLGDGSYDGKAIVTISIAQW